MPGYGQGTRPNKAPFGKRQLEVDQLTDFTGGINYRTDAFQLAQNECTDAENVDMNPDGGFQRRKARVAINSTQVTNNIQSIMQFANSTGTQQILVGNGTKTHYGTGGNFTDTTTTWTTSDRQRAATFNDNLYIQNGTDAPRKWTGAAISTLTVPGYNDTIGAPDFGNMPIARYIAAHRGYVWVGNTFESGTRFPNRIRFSHPSEPEDWRTLDFFDLDKGREGDTIQALIPFKDRLLVFKNKSFHSITGYSAETVASPVAVSYKLGACGPDAVASDGDYVYFFSWPEGVFRYDGDSIEWLFNNIYPKVVDGTIPDGAQSKIALGWVGRRLWVSVPWNGTSDNAKTFLWDPNLGGGTGSRKNTRKGPGGWTRYDFGVQCFMEWRPVDAEALYLGVQVAAKRVEKYDIAQDNDNTTGSNSVTIDGYLDTRWVMGDNAAQRKRFRRVDFVIDNDEKNILHVQVRRDFDLTRYIKEFTVENEPLASGTFTTLWTTDDWDTELVWSGGGGATGGQKIIRAAPLGSGKSMALHIAGPGAADVTAIGNPWAVNAIYVKYIPKTLR